MTPAREPIKIPPYDESQRPSYWKSRYGAHPRYDEVRYALQGGGYHAIRTYTDIGIVRENFLLPEHGKLCILTP